MNDLINKKYEGTPSPSWVAEAIRERSNGGYAKIGDALDERIGSGNIRKVKVTEQIYKDGRTQPVFVAGYNIFDGDIILNDTPVSDSKLIGSLMHETYHHLNAEPLRQLILSEAKNYLGDGGKERLFEEAKSLSKGNGGNTPIERVLDAHTDFEYRAHRIEGHFIKLNFGESELSEPCKIALQGKHTFSEKMRTDYIKFAYQLLISALSRISPESESDV